MKNLFKTIALALVLMTSTSAFAQRSGLNEVGVNFGYMAGAKGMSNVGIGIKYGHMFSDNLRLELGGMYYFKGSKYSLQDLIAGKYIKSDGSLLTGKSTDWFDIDLNGHYLFEVGNNFCIYPIFGFTGMFGHTSIDAVSDWGWSSADVKEYIAGDTDMDDKGKFSDHHFRFGVNIGFGGQYEITEDFAVTLEAKYKLIKDFGDFNLMLGCAVLF